MSEIAEYEYLWDGSQPGWCLVQLKLAPSDQPAYSIYNQPDSTALIIEDDSIFDGVIQRMLAEGCRVLSPREAFG